VSDAETRGVTAPGQQIRAAEANGAARGGHDARDGVEQRAFARAVRSHDGDELAVGDAQRHAAQHGDAAIADLERFDLEHAGPQRFSIGE
jgi:hypothetical protein